MNAKRALIVGAGPAGLSAALTLSRGGWGVTLIERTDAPRGGGFLVSIADSAYAHMMDLGLIDELIRRGSGITRSIYFDAHGRKLADLPTSDLFGDLNVLQLMRNDLTQAMFDVAVSETDIRLQTSVTEMSEHGGGVDIVTSDGGHGTYDVLIGADGVHSQVRERFFRDGTEQRFLGLHCAAFRSPDVLGLRNRFETHTEKNRYMASFNTGGDDIGSVFVWDNAQTGNDFTSPGSMLKQAFTGAGAAITAVLEHAPEDDFYIDELMQIRCARWCSNRVALIGDAAHCLTLFSGRGAAAAINGGRVLGEALVNSGCVTDALGAYERALKNRLTGMQDETLAAIPWYVPRSMWRYQLRTQGLRWAPNRVLNRYFQRKYATV